MSKFHESVRDIIQDVSQFLLHTLQNERLSAATLAHKETILMKLTHLNSEYQQLNLCLPEKLSTPCPPYIDMKGQQQDYVLEDEDLYEECALDKEQCRKSAVRKSGYLEKRGKEGLGRLLTQRKWCTIQGTLLRTYSRSDEKKELCCLDLSGYEARHITGHKEAGFELVCPGRKTYQYVAATAKDLEEWIEAINQVYGEEIYQDNEAEPLYDDGNSDFNTGAGIVEVEDPQNWVLALWDNPAKVGGIELSFKRGDLLHVVSKVYDNVGWWIGEQNGHVGLVPKDYLMEAYEIVMDLNGTTQDTDA